MLYRTIRSAVVTVPLMVFAFAAVVGTSRLAFTRASSYVRGESDVVETVTGPLVRSSDHGAN
jgi:hypothetical protein